MENLLSEINHPLKATAAEIPDLVADASCKFSGHRCATRFVLTILVLERIDCTTTGACNCLWDVHINDDFELTADNSWLAAVCSAGTKHKAGRNEFDWLRT